MHPARGLLLANNALQVTSGPLGVPAGPPRHGPPERPGAGVPATLPSNVYGPFPRASGLRQTAARPNPSLQRARALQRARKRAGFPVATNWL